MSKKLKANKQYSAKGITKEYSPKPSKKLGDKEKLIYILADYRNAIFEVYDEYEEKGLTPLKISLLLWLYPLRFFSRKAVKDNFRIGINGINTRLRDLIRDGWIEKYSPRQMYEKSYYKESSGAVGGYYEVVEEDLPPRYVLSGKGKRFCERLYEMFDRRIWSKDFNNEDRLIEGRW